MGRFELSDHHPVKYWSTLSEAERCFLVEAFDFDQSQPHSSGMDRLIPLMKWRTIGAFCGLSATEADAIVKRLEEKGLVADAGFGDRRMYLSGGRALVREFRERRTRIAWRWVLVASAVAGGIYGIFFGG